MTASLHVGGCLEPSRLATSPADGVARAAHLLALAEWRTARDPGDQLMPGGPGEAARGNAQLLALPSADIFDVNGRGRMWCAPRSHILGATPLPGCRNTGRRHLCQFAKPVLDPVVLAGQVWAAGRRRASTCLCSRPRPRDPRLGRWNGWAASMSCSVLPAHFDSSLLRTSTVRPTVQQLVLSRWVPSACEQTGSKSGGAHDAPGAGSGEGTAAAHRPVLPLCCTS